MKMGIYLTLEQSIQCELALERRLQHQKFLLDCMRRLDSEEAKNLVAAHIKNIAIIQETIKLVDEAVDFLTKEARNDPASRVQSMVSGVAL